MRILAHVTCESEVEHGGYALEPGAPPGFSPLWIVLLKKLEVPGNSFGCVGLNVMD